MVMSKIIVHLVSCLLTILDEVPSADLSNDARSKLFDLRETLKDYTL